MKVALVHDYLLRMGGAERVLFELHKIFPEAPIYTLLYDKEKIGNTFDGAEIRTSFLQKWPNFIKKRHKHLLPFLPVAAESFDLRDFDLIISSSSAFAKSVITRSNALHISYCHAASRFLWDWSGLYLKSLNLGFFRANLARLATHYLRIWDKLSANRVDYFIANSRATRQKIAKYYRTESAVIYPPVSLPVWKEFLNYKRHTSTKISSGYFLIVSQLTAYKNINLAVEAFNKLNLPLVIIGDGPEMVKLKKIAFSNIRFLGWVSDEKRNRYLKNCTAFIFAGEDDFGIAPVEAMGWGKPILALRAGGACETILESVTGEFFDEATPEILADGIRRLCKNLPNYSALVIRKWAEKFSVDKFRQEIVDFVRKMGYNI